MDVLAASGGDGDVPGSYRPSGANPSDGAGSPAAAPPRFPGEAELLAGLNPPQLQAVTHLGGPLLILAGAGSGKTRAITRRIAWLVACQGVPAWRICAITFTNKAAKEMRERVEAQIGARGAWISTFHALCARILRREIEVLGPWTRDFTIYDTQDRQRLIKDLVGGLGYDAARFKPAALGAAISAWKNGRGEEAERRPREEAERRSAERGAPRAVVGIDEEVFEAVRKAYADVLKKNNALDFDDLLLVALELFEREPGVRDLYAQKFLHVLVDEYQDTNRVQYLLVRHLAGAHGNLAVCGDPDQSIYAWRGADIRNILDFERDFGGPGGAPGSTGSAVVEIKLEQNYRSTQVILDAAQGVIEHNASRKQKRLWTERVGGELVCVLECGSEDDEAAEIAAQIRALVDAGRKPDEIAVFYRANFLQRALERGLRLASIPYQIVGGVEFYERREIRDLIAYLQLAVNPRDDAAFARIANVPGRGVGEKSLADFRRFAAERGLALGEALRSSEARTVVKGKARGGLEALAALLEGLRGQAEAPAAEVLAKVIASADYFGWLAELDEPDLASREENVEELLANAEVYDRTNPEGRLRGFLQDVALVSDTDSYDEEQPKVTLMTLHSAKGLEFPVVFMAALEEELVPHARALAEDEQRGLEEERRLVYVGMTRARERLFLSWARQRSHYSGEWMPRQPSRFLAEVPPELVDGADVAAYAEQAERRVELDEVSEIALPRPGERVEHEHFGRGVVERVQGSGASARVQVLFDRHGPKLLIAQYANLRALGPGRTGGTGGTGGARGRRPGGRR